MPKRKVPDIDKGTPDLPNPRQQGSFLVDDTMEISREQRLLEQRGHRKFARVHERYHTSERSQLAPEGELQNNILQNPWLNNQRFDGISPDLNPEPPLNSAARAEYDNQRREQEKEKQLRLGNIPQFSSAPKPQGP